MGRTQLRWGCRESEETIVGSCPAAAGLASLNVGAMIRCLLCLGASARREHGAKSQDLRAKWPGRHIAQGLTR